MQLTRGTIRAYDSGAHTATVTLAHSSRHPIADVPVDVGIPAAEVVAGRECAVVFFTDDNPTDAAIVSIHRAVPGAPFGETFLDLTDTPGAYTGDAGKIVQVNATEDGLEFAAAAAGTPVRIIDTDGDTEVDTENTADVDQILMTIAGTLRYTMKGTTPHHTLAGDVYIDEKLDVGNTGGLGTTFNAQHDGGAVSANVNVAGVGFNVNPTPTADVSIQGLVSQPGVVSSTGRSLIAKGLLFFASAVGPGTFAVLTSVEGRSFLASGGTAPIITSMAQFHANSLIGGASGAVAEAHAFRASNQGCAAMTDVYHFRSHAISAGTNRRPFWDEGSDDDDGDGNAFYSNTRFGTLAVTGVFGGGDGVIHLHDARTAPTTDPTAGGILYSEAGALKWRGSSGTVTTLAPA